MQLTKQTDYAFRVLMYLGRLPEGELAQIQQICAFYDISANHLAKVVVKLAKLGYITAYRGKGGGLMLAKDPARIPLDDIVKAFETTMKPVSCDQPQCRIAGNCELKGILFNAMQQFLKTLGQHTLADILDKPLEQAVNVQ
jgi:Rrf2 family nitric oxide-sensitive transcriptional repressor